MKKGVKFTEEHKRKISDALRGNKNGIGNKGSRGKKPWNKGLTGYSTSLKGRHLSEETKRKISEAHKEKPGGMLGKKHSEETKRKISEAQTGEKHHLWGKHRSRETRKRISEAKMAEKNPMWRGDKVGYAALHDWIKSRKPKPKLCSLCQKRPAYDLANISGKYKRDLNDWEWICRRCHMVKDGRLKTFFLSRHTKRGS